MLAGSVPNLAQPCHQSHPQSSSQPAQLPREHKAIAGHKDTARSCPQCSPRGAWGQVVGHGGIGTKAWGQRVRHRYKGMGHRSAEMWGWRDTGAGTQGHGSAGTQGHLGTEDWDMGPGTQGCRDLCCSTTVSSMHHCSSPSQSLGNYELLPGSSVCPRNGIRWMGSSQQSDGHTQPQNPALELLGSNCRC